MRKVYNLPPGWPEPSPGWRPEPDWQPNAQWSVPAGWDLWVEVPDTALIGADAVTIDVPDGEAGKGSRRTSLLVLAGLAVTVVVFLLGLGAGGGSQGARAAADAEASASAEAAGLAEQRSTLETETGALAEAQEALEADQTKLASDQKSLSTKASDVTEKVEDVETREAAVKTAEKQADTRESDVAEREAAVETAEAAALAGVAGSAADESSDDVAADTGGSAYYDNCDAARADGAAPVRAGDPGYGSHLDRDGDGVGCE